MLSFLDFIAESTDQPYSNKKLKLDTPHFEGHAHIKYSRPIGRKHDVHEYSVNYRGTHKEDGRKIDQHNRMVVRHGNDGTPYEHQIDGKKHKNIADALKSHAPGKLISYKDLK